jgi:hypothetical protein
MRTTYNPPGPALTRQVQGNVTMDDFDRYPCPGPVCPPGIVRTFEEIETICKLCLAKRKTEFLDVLAVTSPASLEQWHELTTDITHQQILSTERRVGTDQLRSGDRRGVWDRPSHGIHCTL